MSERGIDARGSTGSATSPEGSASELRVPPSTVSVSVVVYHPDVPLLRQTLQCLSVSLTEARAQGAIGGASLVIVDNGTRDEARLDAAVAGGIAGAPWAAVRTLRGHGNVGYGLGHNLAIESSDATFHLVLNPDALSRPATVVEAIRFLHARPEVGMLAPEVTGADGERQFLCRRPPTLFGLLLRGFAPAPVKRAFRAYLERYEMRDVIAPATHAPVLGVPIISGCFMFARRDVLQRVGGFSPRYFLYFEDYDLSLAVGRVAQVAYVPAVKIVHLGGGAARKGMLHTRLFLSGARTFFSAHGWRLV